MIKAKFKSRVVIPPKKNLCPIGSPWEVQRRGLILWGLGSSIHASGLAPKQHV